MSTLTKSKSKEQVSIAQATTDVTIIKDCVFTNNSKQDIMVLRAYADVETNPPKEIFEETLTILPTKDNQKIIKAGTTGTITLDFQHKDEDGNDIDTTAYEFIIVRADCLFPVKAASTVRTVSTDKTQKYYPGVTITDDDYTNMKSAETFQLNIMAYPSYQLGKDYQTALNSAANASDDDDTDYIGNFFKTKTINYQKVTLDMVTAVTTYYEQFPYRWTDYKTSKTYYLYSTDDNVIKYAGTLDITCPTDIPADVDKSLPKFTLNFTDSGNAVTALTYLNGQFVDQETDVPEMCFQGSFARKSDLSHVNTDSDVISVIVGRIGNLNIIGFDQKQTETKVVDDNGDTSEKWSGTYDLLHVTNLGKAITLIFTAGGLIMVFKEIYNGVQKFKQWRKQKQADKAEKGDDSPLTKADLDALKAKLDAYNAGIQAEIQTTVKKVEPTAEVVTPETLKQSMEAYSKAITENVTKSLKDHLQDALDNQTELLEGILKYTSSPVTDLVSDHIQDAQDKLDKANSPDEISAIATDLTQQVTTINMDLIKDYGIAMKKATGSEKAEMEDAKAEADERAAESEVLDNQRQNSENETEPEDNEYPPEDWEAY